MHATDSQPKSPARSGAWGWILLALVAAGSFAYLVVATAPSARDAGTSNPAVGRTLQYLRLEPLAGGGDYVSIDDLRGRVSVINFWGTWCGPCIREFPDLVQMAERFADREDFRFYPVSCGQGEDIEVDELRLATEEFLQARNVQLVTYSDQNAATRHALSMLLSLPQFAYPMTLVVDQSGKIRGFWVGYDPRYVGHMTSLVQELLDKADAVPPASS
ncbi:MAG: TlpA family protein disulfide reductase [Pirellulales bacterium]